MFGQYQNALQKLIGQSAAAELIRNAIYNINVGGNDWINNYVASSSRTPASDYTDFLISTYAQHLKVYIHFSTLDIRSFAISAVT